MGLVYLQFREFVDGRSEFLLYVTDTGLNPVSIRIRMHSLSTYNKAGLPRPDTQICQFMHSIPFPTPRRMYRLKDGGGQLTDPASSRNCSHYCKYVSCISDVQI